MPRSPWVPLTGVLAIATLRVWMKPTPLGIYPLLAPLLLAGVSAIRLDSIRRFLTEDIVPAPLRDANPLDPQSWSNLADWVAMLLTDQALPGIVATVLLTQIALVARAFLSLAFFPLISTWPSPTCPRPR